MRSKELNRRTKRFDLLMDFAPRAVGYTAAATRAVSVLSLTWTDNADGTATIDVTFDQSVYCGIDYGTSTETYTASAISYTVDEPASGVPLFSATHSFPVPEQTIGTETLADGTYYWRLAAGGSGYNDLGYMAAEQTGVISTPDGIGLEGSTDELLMETGDMILVESGAETDISAFSAASTLGGTEVVAGVQSAATVKITIDQIKTYVSA